jgi:hypothetical protein
MSVENTTEELYQIILKSKTKQEAFDNLLVWADGNMAFAGPITDVLRNYTSIKNEEAYRTTKLYKNIKGLK